MYSFLTILFFYFKCFPDKKWSFRMVFKTEKYVSNLCIARERRNKVNCKKKRILTKLGYDKGNTK